jgi:hypothetical protein
VTEDRGDQSEEEELRERYSVFVVARFVFGTATGIVLGT